MDIVIKTFSHLGNGRSVSMTVALTDLMRDVKTRYVQSSPEAERGTRPAECRFMLQEQSGYVELEDGRAVAEYSIRDGITLHAMRGLRKVNNPALRAALARPNASGARFMRSRASPGGYGLTCETNSARCTATWRRLTTQASWRTSEMLERSVPCTRGLILLQERVKPTRARSRIPFPRP